MIRTDINRQWVLAQRPDGIVCEDNFRFIEAPIPALAEGQVLVRNLLLSCDPHQRLLMSRDTMVPIMPLDKVVGAVGVGQVVESRRSDYQPGELVTGYFGWQDYAATNGTEWVPMQKLQPSVPPNLALSLFGITGLTAYFGVLDIGRISAGETFVVSGAAGATGSIAGQIAKIKGCKVIGIAGGRAKCDCLKNELGFDAAIDYRAENVGAELNALCPEGIDVFFDNVGGRVLEEVLTRLRLNGRIVLCGAISSYSDTARPPGPSNYLELVLKRGRMEGFIVIDYATRFAEAIAALASWFAEGKLTQKEDVKIGLENAPRTFARLFTGDNLGKQLLTIADPPLTRIN
jgi:NADPH-dependent curcumin reductase CurA